MPANPPPPNPLPCGCHIEDFGGPRKIDFCPLHQAAGNMLGVLQLISDLAWADGDASRQLRAIARHADAAVLKARPAKEKRAGEENRAI